MQTLLKNIILFSLIMLTVQAQAQVKVVPLPAEKKVIISINNKPFTEYLFPDSLEKPVLYPLRSASGNIVTRGFPLHPLPGERTDHPHHVGLWFDYENVNGLDFWNNSYAIPAKNKSHYGWIKQQQILKAKSGKKGLLKISANWEKQDGTILLKEISTFIFSGNETQRIIDRTTTLTAQQKVEFKDAKDGMLGVRVARQLELPVTQSESFADDKGNITTVDADGHKIANGNYLTSEGKTGDSAWGTRGRWCMLYGEKEGEMITLGIIDHPKNPGYPTYWHARGYGLFAANPLGQKIFSNGEKTMDLTLQPGQSVTFRYRIVILNGKASKVQMDKLAGAFAKTP